ncbi:MAG: EthD family reductase [Acidimicrobiia bacterium]
MNAAYLVVYQGRPKDPQAFLAYYIERHVPLVWQLPEIRGIELHVGSDEGDIFLMTRLLFDNLDHLRAAISSDQRRVTRRDLEENLLPNFEGTVRHQVTEVRVMEPST